MIIRCSPDDELWQSVTAELEKHRYDGFVLDDSKPSAIVTSERYEEMWNAILATCKELQTQPGSRPDMRSAGGLGWDGREMSAIVKAGHDDGTRSVYHVGAHLEGPHPRDRITVTVDGPWLDSSDRFWGEQASDRRGAVVIGHEHYRICPDLPESRRDCAGYGGSLHRIRMLASGAVIVTRNLWHQGTIPPSWRDRLPADAEFVPAEVTA
jgi:hypothetical protein